MKGKTDINLKMAPWFAAASVRQVFELLGGTGGEVAIVGGAVRNHLLDVPVSDIDFATTLLPETVQERAAKANLKAIPTGIDHGTITLIIDNQSYEVTTLRRDITTDGRRAIVAYGTDWLEDAKRRDFTCNALYIDNEGTVYDPLCEGLMDIKQGRIRFIGDPGTRIREDHLRILRLYRFQAHYGKKPLDSQAVTAVINERLGIRSLSADRRRDEMLKLLAAEEPQNAIRQMMHHGLLTLVLAQAPNINRLNKYLAIETALGEEPDPLLRLGVLYIYHNQDAQRLANHMALSKQQLKVIKPLAETTTMPALETTEPALKAHRIAHYKRGKTGYLTALKASWVKSSRSPADLMLKQLYKGAKDWAVKTFPLEGKDLIKAGIRPGPEIGTLLGKLETLWLEEDMQPGATELLRKLPLIHMKFQGPTSQRPT